MIQSRLDSTDALPGRHLPYLALLGETLNEATIRVAVFRNGEVSWHGGSDKKVWAGLRAHDKPAVRSVAGNSSRAWFWPWKLTTCNVLAELDLSKILDDPERTF